MSEATLTVSFFWQRSKAFEPSKGKSKGKRREITVADVCVCSSRKLFICNRKETTGEAEKQTQSAILVQSAE